jgi:hypothetical protein
MEYDEGRMMTCRRPLDVVMGKNYSIYNQCRECCGWEADPTVGGTLADEVARCTATECPLWEVRLPQSQLSRKKAQRSPIVAFEEEAIGSYTPSSNRATIEVENESRATIDRTRAINRFCRYCMCIEPRTEATPIKECVSDQCWLWPHRPGV